jgi:hypothetical protein|tara:strand:- start:743 stop:976 length:234 start_codon:yes stop_codon:yes gene_type:complete
MERLGRRIRKLTDVSDWPEVNNMFEQICYWPKSKWMRWKTFEQKRNKIIELEKRYWPMVDTQLKAMFSDNFMLSKNN